MDTHEGQRKRSPAPHTGHPESGGIDTIQATNQTGEKDSPERKIMKTFDLVKYGTIHKIQLNVTAYCNGGGLAVVMTDWESGEAEPWNVLTVNLDSVCPRDCAYIDTNNNGEDILAWIIRHGLAAPTSRYGYSGYCRYPEYRFRPEVLRELDPDGYSAYLNDYEKKYGTGRDTHEK